MNTERVRTLLIPALRDPKRTQTQGALRRRGAEEVGYPDGDCCLGVACDVSGLGEWANEPGVDGMVTYTVYDGSGYPVDWNSEDLPGPVREFYGFPDAGGGEIEVDGDVRPLWEHNDLGVPFAKLADALEAECDRIDGVNRG